MAPINILGNQAQVPPTLFRCPACPRTFEGSVSFSRHLRLHRPHERIRRRNAESDVDADEAVMEAQNNNSQNQAPLLPTIFLCPECHLTFEGSVSFSNHVRLHRPQEPLGPRNLEPDVAAEELPRVPEPLVEPIPPPPAALPRSRNAVESSVPPPVEGLPQQPVLAIPGAVNVVGPTGSCPIFDSEGMTGEGTKSKGAVEEAVVEAPQVAVPPATVPPAVVPQVEIEVEQPRARPMFDLNELPPMLDLNKLPDEQDQ